MISFEVAANRANKRATTCQLALRAIFVVTLFTVTLQWTSLKSSNKHVFIVQICQQVDNHVHRQEQLDN